ncbi:hypothetical protein [Dyadobacter sp. CY356]|uniref:hypothetical protein n=1 Tax=Dyadobacter sp. CY356 TaxID=2906442 RepID=UPI001F3B3E59|nr:hypothetical protein [Dyadobacter sp. CY356]MCF0056279.1 hypothetical protein [Dyadobacter sp. CY356]
MNLFKIAAGISLLSCVVLVIVKVYFSMTFLPDMSGSEASTIFPIQFLTDNRPIYTDPENAPFRFTQYTPIYFFITSFCLKLNGWLPEDVHKVFVSNRFISITLTVLTSLVVAYILTKLTKRKKMVGILIACFVFQVLGLWILTSSRPDSLIVLLTALYVCAIFKGITSASQSDLWYILAIFISVSAFFVKQSGTIHAIALGIFCIYQYQWKLLAKLILSGLVFFGLYLLVLPINTIPVFFSNIVGGVENSVSWNWFYDWTLKRFLLQFAPLIICNFIVTFHTLTHKESVFYRFLAIASSMFFLFATATAFKVGAGVGYYQDYLILAVIQITLFFTEPERKNLFQPKILRAMLASYLIIVAIHCTLFVYMTYQIQPHSLYTHQYFTEREVANFLVNEKNLIDKEWVYVCDADNYQGVYLKHFLFKNILLPFTDVVYLADKNKTFDFRNFENMVSENKIRFVVAKRGETPKNVLGYEFPDLKKIKTIDKYDIYEQ